VLAAAKLKGISRAIGGEKKGLVIQSKMRELHWPAAARKRQTCARSVVKKKKKRRSALLLRIQSLEGTPAGKKGNLFLLLNPTKKGKFLSGPPLPKRRLKPTPRGGGKAGPCVQAKTSS